MYTELLRLRENISKRDNVNEIYEAMTRGDLSEIVLTAMKFITAESLDLTSIKKMKSEKVSEEYRIMGNNLLGKGRLQDTLNFYNSAMLHAPNNSRALKLAISNRSAVSIKLKAYQACIDDIEYCFKIGCPGDVKDKLKKRQAEAAKSISIENINAQIDNRCADAFLQVNFTGNPQIPYVSDNVKIFGSTKKEAIALKEIKAGTVIAYEKAYASYTDPANAIYSCHYCQRMSLNLLPCDSCCSALFCSEQCRMQCNEEYHKYECHIIDGIKKLSNVPSQNLLVKTIFKMRSKCKWEDIINASKKLGLKRIADSSDEEVFDSNDVFSCLNINDDRPFIHGQLFNGGIFCAVVLRYIERIPLFYPDNRVERQQAEEALARIMLFLYVYQSPTLTYQAVTSISDYKSSLHDIPNSGIFTFTGKLKMSCTPNLFAVNKNNELILIAIHTINAGETLTLSRPLHLLDSRVERIVRNMLCFTLYGDVCDCVNCRGDLTNIRTLSESQKNYYNNLDFTSIDRSLDLYMIGDIKILEAMTVLKNVPYSDEYKHVYQRFRRAVMFYEATKGKNYNICKS